MIVALNRMTNAQEVMKIVVRASLYLNISSIGDQEGVLLTQSLMRLKVFKKSQISKNIHLHPNLKKSGHTKCTWFEMQANLGGQKVGNQNLCFDLFFCFHAQGN